MNVHVERSLKFNRSFHMAEINVQIVKVAMKCSDDDFTDNYLQVSVCALIHCQRCQPLEILILEIFSFVLIPPYKLMTLIPTKPPP